MGNPTVLIVDDQPASIQAIRMLLLAGIPGIHVISATTVKEAMSLLKEHQPDVAIVDMHLPVERLATTECDAGYNLVRAIKEETPSTRVIAYTGYPDRDLTVSCMRAGCFDFVFKGDPGDRILDSVRRAIQLETLSIDRDSLAERLILANWDDLRKPLDSRKKGVALEGLCNLLFRTVPGWQQVESRVRTKTEEIDLVILNESQEEFWKRFGSLLLVECKNWTRDAKPGRKDFDAFYSKLQRRGGKGCRLGFFVSLGGVAETFETEIGRIAKEDTVIVPLKEDNLWRMICADNRSRFLKERVAAQMLT